MTLIISNQEAAAVLTMTDCIAGLEEGYRELALGRAVNCPRTDMLFPTADPSTFYKFKCIQGGIARLGVVGQRTQSDLDHFYRQKGELKLADHREEYVSNVFLYSMENLQLLAVIQDGELQRMRVAGMCAVAAKYLAREDARIVGLYGAGFQAASMVSAMAAVRPIECVRVFSPTKERRLRFCQDMEEKHSLEVLPMERPEDVPRDADIVACATNSAEAGGVCRGAWLSEGSYLTSIKYREFDAAVYARAQRIFHTNLTEDLSHFYRLYTPRDLQVPERSARAAGEDRTFYEAYGDKMHSLEDLLLGKVVGRRKAADTVMYMKGMGTGTEFTVTAKFVYDRARSQGLGREVPSEWFSQVTHAPWHGSPGQ